MMNINMDNMNINMDSNKDIIIINMDINMYLYHISVTDCGRVLKFSASTHHHSHHDEHKHDKVHCSTLNMRVIWIWSKIISF